MVYLLLRVLLTVGFAQSVRYLQGRQRPVLPPLLVNYVVAAAVCGAWAVGLGAEWVDGPTLALAVLGGTTYVTSLALLLPAMRTAGVAITGALLQLALMVPVSLAVVRYGEVLTPYHLWGIALTCVALPILSASSATGRRQRQRFTLLLPLLFLSSGLSQTVFKEVAHRGAGAAERLAFMALLFVVSILGTAVWMWWFPEATNDQRSTTSDEAEVGRARRTEESTPQGRPADGLATPSPSAIAASDRGSFVVGRWSPSNDLLLGTLIGLVNAGQMLCLLLALEELPSVVVFPVSSALGVMGNIAAAMTLWGERPTRAAWFGMALAIAAVVLLNL